MPGGIIATQYLKQLHMCIKKLERRNWEMSGDIVTVQILVNRIPQFKSFLTGFGCSGSHTKKTSMTQQQAMSVRL